MNEGAKGTLLVIAAFAVALAIAVACGKSGLAQSAGAGLPPKMAEEAYKNIQVLKGVPADQVVPTMQFISSSLGVECNYCHVERAFEKDDKKEKRTARKMIQMMLAINTDDFKGRREVTCYSCHRGAAEPVGTPILTDEEVRPEPAGSNAPGAKPAASPSADQLIEKYAQAVGGVEAFQKISSRVEKGTLTAFGGRHFPAEVFAKAPDKRMSVMHLPSGESVTAFDGHAGWLRFSAQPPHEMAGAEVDAARLDADFYFPVHVKQLFTELRVRPPEKVGEHETYVVFGVKPGQPPVELYFDKQSGLLVRLVRYAETPLGRNPTQIDYADYRDADGIKVPFRWTLARPGGRFTIQVDQIQQNIPIDDAKFAQPAVPVAQEQKAPSPQGSSTNPHGN